MRRRLLLLGIATAGICGDALAANLRDAYPTKPIQLIIPFAAGGPTDILGRFLANSMSEQLGQTVVVLNRPGAGGNIGTQQVARMAPDGYALLLTASSHVINPAVYAQVQYDPTTGFTPISLLASGPFILTVRNGLEVNSVADLVRLSKQKSGSISYSSAGTGTANHLAGELFKQMTGAEMIHVPYNGAAPASQAIAGGVVDVLFNNMLSGLPMVRGKQVRALAVTGPKRSPAAPDLPTISESGVAGFDVQTWYALLAPHGLPPEIQAALNSAAIEAFADPKGRTLLERQGLESSSLRPEQVASFLEEEQKKWAKTAKASGAKVD